MIIATIYWALQLLDRIVWMTHRQTIFLLYSTIKAFAQKVFNLRLKIACISNMVEAMGNQEATYKLNRLRITASKSMYIPRKWMSTEKVFRCFVWVGTKHLKTFCNNFSFKIATTVNIFLVTSSKNIKP